MEVGKVEIDGEILSNVLLSCIGYCGWNGDAITKFKSLPVKIIEYYMNKVREQLIILDMNDKLNDPEVYNSKGFHVAKQIFDYNVTMNDLRYELTVYYRCFFEKESTWFETVDSTHVYYFVKGKYLAALAIHDMHAIKLQEQA